MANWFGNSTSLFKGRAPETPQPFEIDCECGQRHSGLRRQQHQRIICRACGTALFILPKDVYPASTDTVPSSRGQAFSVDVLEEEDFASSEPEAVAEAPARKKKNAGKGPTAQSTRGAAGATKSRPATQQPPLPAPQVARQEKPKPRGPFWTPLRIVSVAMVTIVAVTLFAVAWTQRLEDARRRLAAAVEQFNTALEREDWPVARSQINQIVECLDILGRDDASAQRHRQFQREIQAMTDLAGSSLFDIVEESDADQARDAVNWHDAFDSHHAGDWLVMELPARRRLLPADRSADDDNVEEEAPPRYAYDFDVPVAIGDRGRYVEIQLSFEALDRLPWDDDRSRTVVVCAQLSDLKLSADGDHWIVSFDSATAFLWANIETYEGLGFTFADWNPREQMLALLNEQASAMGLTVPSEPSAAPASTEIAWSIQEGRE